MFYSLLTLLFPVSHDDVVKVVELACKHNVVIIPFGGKCSHLFAIMYYCYDSTITSASVTL